MWLPIMLNGIMGYLGAKPQKYLPNEKILILQIQFFHVFDRLYKNKY